MLKRCEKQKRITEQLFLCPAPCRGNMPLGDVWGTQLVGEKESSLLDFYRLYCLAMLQ